MSDRTIHARYPGMEIVRYDRAGKWYLEPTLTGLRRQAVTLKQAVLQARWALEHSGQVFFDRPGGGAFDRGVRTLLNGQSPAPATEERS